MKHIRTFEKYINEQYKKIDVQNIIDFMEKNNLKEIKFEKSIFIDKYTTSITGVVFDDKYDFCYQLSSNYRQKNKFTKNLWNCSLSELEKVYDYLNSMTPEEIKEAQMKQEAKKFGL